MGDEMWCCNSWYYMDYAWYYINDSLWLENSNWIYYDLFDCGRQ
jgi:hypothetical protein